MLHNPVFLKIKPGNNQAIVVLGSESLSFPGRSQEDPPKPCEEYMETICTIIATSLYI